MGPCKAGVCVCVCVCVCVGGPASVRSNVLLLLNNVARNPQPQLLPQGLVFDGLIGVELGLFQVLMLTKCATAATGGAAGALATHRRGIAVPVRRARPHLECQLHCLFVQPHRRIDQDARLRLVVLHAQTQRVLQVVEATL